MTSTTLTINKDIFSVFSYKSLSGILSIGIPISDVSTCSQNLRCFIVFPRHG